MSSSVEEFEEIFNNEMHIDTEKLRDLASGGVPESVRGLTWKYLLNVVPPDKSREEAAAAALEQGYQRLSKDTAGEHTKRLRGEVKRYNAALFTSEAQRRRLENVVGAYIGKADVAYSPSLVHLCGPFVYLMGSEAEALSCVEALMERMPPTDPHSTTRATGVFMTYFRTLVPGLYNHFEEEELESRQWVPNWLRHFFAFELPLPCLLRLWDTYICEPDGFDLHPFVCLAFLMQFKDEMEEMENYEIRAFLQHLPTVDMDQIIAKAENVREDVVALNLI